MITTQKKERFSWNKILWMYASILLAIILLASLGLWVCLANYEATQPYKPVEKIITQLENKDFNAFLKDGGYAFSEIEPIEKSLFYLANKEGLNTTPLTYYPTSQKGDSYCYTIKNEAISFQIITEKSDKTTLWGDAVYRVKQIDGLLPEFQEWMIQLPQEAVILLNNQPLSQGAHLVDNVNLALQHSLPFETALNYSVYQTQPLRFLPEIYPVNPKESWEINIQPETHKIFLTPPVENYGEKEKLAQTVAKLYARFITKDASFADLNAYLVKGSDVYNNLSTFFNGWYIDHNEYVFEDMKTLNITQYDKDHFSCELSFMYLIKRGEKVYTYPSRYTLYFLKEANGFKLCSLQVH